MTEAGGGLPLGAFLFSIAILTDTHLNEAEYESNSPFECNRMANARTRWVIDAVNECQPAVTVHLGDLVHPVPTLPTYADAADHFKRLTRVLQNPLHLMPGNHDVGDKPVVWAPSSTVSEASLARWHEHFGRHYYAVRCRDVALVVIDAQIINSGLPAEGDQREWLERELSGSVGTRTFLCLHYPPISSIPMSVRATTTWANLGAHGCWAWSSATSPKRCSAGTCTTSSTIGTGRRSATSCRQPRSSARITVSSHGRRRGTSGAQ